MKNLLIIPLAITGIMLCSFQPVDKPAYSVKKIVIDAGHGGFDPGCSGSYSKEKELTLEIAFELGKLISTFHKDVEIIYTRTKNQYVNLHERAMIANRASADLFISIHCNAYPKENIHGTETYTMGLSHTNDNLAVAMRENSVILQEEGYLQLYDGFDPKSPVSYILLSNLQQAYQENSLAFASLIENEFGKTNERPNRGVKQAGFLVLAKTTMPSVLVEVGFLTNKEEEKYLNSDLGKAKVAANLYRAFRNYKRDLEARSN
ncbi:MAG: N-acetylmuramoyl-L-alanine amidase [Thalassobius sp.]|nr:N-acetylmuramoyl-L-alanine amidase [Thalassovita sp.]